jgi:hypothetical protein
MRICTKYARVHFLPLLAGLFLLASCGEEFNVNQLPVAVEGFRVVQDTTYVEQKPIWAFGFNKPQDIHIGFDNLLYVCDTENNRIVMMNLAGSVVGSSRFIKRPVAITQDRRFGLIVAAEFDTTIGGSFLTYGALYKIALYDPQNGIYHDLNAAFPRRIHWEPPYPQRRFTGVSTLIDNSYYVTRAGPDNSSIIDPDNSVLHFSKNDVLYPRDLIDLSPDLSPIGFGLTGIPGLSGIVTFSERRLQTDFIVVQTEQSHQFKFQWLKFTPGNDFAPPVWESQFRPGGSPATTVDILRGMFQRPEDVTLDNRGNIYVIDAGLDSLMKFGRDGRMSNHSFGPFKTRNALRQPMGITWFDRTLYIADTGNDRIIRYRLSTDF